MKVLEILSMFGTPAKKRMYKNKENVCSLLRLKFKVQMKLEWIQNI